MQAIELINQCAREYQDIAFERIAKSGSAQANWLQFLNDGQRAVVIVRPDANAVTQAVQLVPGTRQSLPAGGLRLLDVTRNMGSAGTTAGSAIRLAERQSMDMADRSWHTAPPNVKVRELLYDEKKDPTSYWVSPPVPLAQSVYIEIIFSKSPTDITDADAGAITISDVYAPALIEWMLYRAFSLQTQALNVQQRASFKYQTFFNLLGVKLRGDVFTGGTADNIYPQKAIA